MRPRKRTNAKGELLESAFGTQVENLLDVYGWRWFHAPDNRPVKASTGRTYVQAVRRGFPDYVALRGPELLIIELKAERGRLGDGQAEWLEAWRAFGWVVNVAGRHTAGAGLATHWRHRETGDLVELGNGRREEDVTAYEAIGLYPTVDVYVWRPSDLEAINDRLSRGGHRHPLAC